MTAAQPHPCIDCRSIGTHQPWCTSLPEPTLRDRAMLELDLRAANAEGLLRFTLADLAKAEARQVEARRLLANASQSLARVLRSELPEGAVTELTWIGTMLDRALLALSERGGR